MEQLHCVWVWLDSEVVFSWIGRSGGKEADESEPTETHRIGSQLPETKNKYGSSFVNIT
jgi:hypothetical protein